MTAFLAGVAGIEPAQRVLETLVLPLYDTPLIKIGDLCTTAIFTRKIRQSETKAGNAPTCDIVTCLTKNRELFTLGMTGVLSAKATVFTQRKLFLHLFFIALGVMSDTTAHGTLKFHQSIFDLTHTLSITYCL